MSTTSVLRDVPQPVRGAMVGVVCAGLAGGLTGLIIGLFTNWPTAPFAAVELGLPAAVAGGVVGLGAGAVVRAARRRPRSRR